jgi:hypothetical protein
MKISILKADYHNSEHARAMVDLLEAYACDPMGGGESLSPFVKDNLVAELAKRSFALSLIAFVDTKPVGITECI